MCTSLKYRNCMGRNFDYEVSYNEELRVIDSMEFDNELKVMGMCTGFVKDYPLLYDGINEKGLCCSALAFTGNAKYFDEADDKTNIPAFDFVFRILSSFNSVNDVKEFLQENDVNIDNRQYSKEFPNSDLHWFVCDEDESMIIEQTEDGLSYYGGEVMTNNPPYPEQVSICKKDLKKVGSDDLVLPEYNTRGTETYGLLGDYTSFARFSKLTFLRDKMEEYSEDKFDNVAQTFHLLSSIEQVYGLTPVGDKFEYTIYSVVYDMFNLKVYLRFYNELEYHICEMF